MPIYDQLRNVMMRESGKSDQQQAMPRYGIVESYDPSKHRMKCSLTPEKKIDGGKIMTGWLQIVNPMCGPNWGIVSTFEQGDQVIMLPLNNSGSEFVVLGGLYSTKEPVAQGENDIGGSDQTTEIGQFLLHSKSGTTMKFVDNNTMVIKATYEKHDVTHIITKGTDVHVTASDFVTVDCKDCNVNASNNINAKANNNINAKAGNAIDANAGSQATVTAPQITLNGEVQVNGNITCSGNITDFAISMAGMRDLYNPHVHGDSSGPIPEMPP